MTILVTGGAGYIGSHTVKLLRSLGRDVVAFDSLERGNRDSLLGAPLVVGDIADEHVVEHTCREHGVTDIVHFAAYKSAG
ncbi:MAG: NAD-dependent epimerase/dehydratase family protein, partial [Actinomycetota bacterium]